MTPPRFGDVNSTTSTRTGHSTRASEATSTATSLAVVPFVPRVENIGTMPAGFHPAPAPPRYPEFQEPEERADEEELEDEVPPQGTDFLYNEGLINDLMRDRFGTARAEVNRKKSEMQGEAVNVRGQVWFIRDDVAVDNTIGEDFLEQGLRSNSVDCESLPRRFRTKNEVLNGIRASPRTPKVKRDETKAIHATFMELYPVNWKQSLKRLNKAISDDPLTSTRKSSYELSEREYFIFIGILLLAGVQATGGCESLYTGKGTQGIVPKVKAAEYMSFTRFKLIKQYWIKQFELDIDDEQKEKNKWWRMGYLIHGFNENRNRTVAASRVLTLDESMSAFRPQTSKTGNLPNISFILRKPEDLGTELKAVASTSCNGPILHLEVQEGKENMKTKSYFDSYGVSTACTLRMAKQTKNNGNKPDPSITNLFYGDSWFSSVKTALAIKKELQCEYVGVIKNGHRDYPRVYLEETMKDWPPGSHLVLETTKDDELLYAIGYKYNMKKVLLFIATENAGTTMPGTPYEAKWLDDNGRMTSRQVPRPHLISEYYKNSNQIDKHNHARQGVLALEKNIVTHCGYFRLFTTYLGITVTDAWKLYRNGLGEKHINKNVSITEFANILCKSNLLNDYKHKINESNPLPTLPQISQLLAMNLISHNPSSPQHQLPPTSQLLDLPTL